MKDCLEQAFAEAQASPYEAEGEDDSSQGLDDEGDSGYLAYEPHSVAWRVPVTKLLASGEQVPEATLRPTNKAPNVVKVMIPIPPTWMRSMTTTLPKVVNVTGYSTDESPVTLVALTETKRASTQEIPP